MSLKVWLPLTKDLRNQGLDNVMVTNNGATFDANGKLGGCYYFNRSAPNYLKITNPLTTATNGVSMAFWVKLPSNGSVNDQLVHIGNGSGWTNNRFTCFVRGGNSTLIFACGDGTNSTQYSCTSSALTLNQWTHVVCLYENNKMKIYLNGALDKEYSTTIVPSFTNVTYVGIGAGPNVTEPATVYLNDIRIYDHALSPLEVKEISKGLVLHYPLSDNSIQSLDNCYAYPRFETNNSNGGWSHWGSSGHAGTYGQTTDTNYIFRNGQTYAHWVANGSSATKDYLLYQEPVFDGGLRSLVAICKEENSKPITNNICYATWNARNGGAVNNSWTSIHSLGNGFYLCKCEGISQDGSNDLVGIYIKPGYKVYFSEVYLENYKSVCSDIFFSSTVIYDTSGYGNNGTPIGSFSVDKSTPRYNMSIVFNGVDNCMQIGNWYNLFQNPFTVNVWFKKDEIGSKSYETLFGGASGFEIDTRAGNSQTLSLYLPSPRGVNAYSPFNLNQWYMVTMVSDGINEEFYVDGILRKTIEKKVMTNSVYRIGAWNSDTSQNFKGQMSDFRIYATALSAEDVKNLYELGATIDTNGVLSTYEFTEQ